MAVKRSFLYFVKLWRRLPACAASGLPARWMGTVNTRLEGRMPHGLEARTAFTGRMTK